MHKRLIDRVPAEVLTANRDGETELIGWRLAWQWAVDERGQLLTRLDGRSPWRHASLVLDPTPMTATLGRVVARYGLLDDLLATDGYTEPPRGPVPR